MNYSEKYKWKFRSYYGVVLTTQVKLYAQRAIIVSNFPAKFRFATVRCWCFCFYFYFWLSVCMSHTVTVKRISCMQLISFCFSIFSHPKICIAHIEIPHEKSFKWRGIYLNATIWFGTYLSEKHASVTCQRFKFQFISMLMVNVCDWMFYFRSLQFKV